MSSKISKLVLQYVGAALIGSFGSTVWSQNSNIDSLTGPVTAHEISTFKAAIAGLVPGGSNSGNNYAYGNSGDAMEACADMYDVTKDRAILDKLILYCDKLVSIRNATRVMWTGNIDPVWPNADNATWGCEQGDVAGHMAYCAQLIGQNPTLWDLPVGIGDPNGYGATYKQRAELYLTVIDTVMDLFYEHNFIHMDEIMQTPPTPPWPDPNSANDAVPWNQQSMICSALIRGADAHSLFGDNSSRIAKFRKTAKASITRYFAQCNNFKYTKNSKTVCKWSYSGGTFKPGDPIRYTEDTAHGGYDITAIFRARHWLANAVKVPDAQMVADTLMEVIKSGDQFWSRVDGTGTLNGGMKNSWTYLSEWRTDAFDATTNTGSQRYADAAKKLWIKNAMYIGWKTSMSLGLNLRDGWIDTDVGEPAMTGDASLASGVFTLHGGGTDLGPTSDQFNFTYEPVANDFDFVARVVSQSNTNASARSGLMVRAGLDANAPSVSLVVTPTSDLQMLYRSAAGDSVTTLATVPSIVAPCWLRLVRQGSSFTGYRSSNGSSWTTVGTISVTISKATVGLMVNAHTSTTLNTSTFDQVSLVASGFGLDVDPSSGSILPGGTTTYTAHSIPTNGFNGSVTLSVAGLPHNVTASFNPPTITSTGSSVLTLTAPATASPGSFTLTITGTSGELTSDTTAGLAVNELPPSPDTKIVAADNTWVLRSGNTTVQSSADTLQVKRLNDSNSRISYVRFNVNSFLNSHALSQMSAAKLHLTIPTATSGGGTLSIHGLVDSATGENWSSTTMTWNNQPAKSAAPNDLSTSDTALPNANTTALLGTVSIPSSATEVIANLNLQNFTAFLGADTNRQVTLLFVNNTATSISFASLTNANGTPPPILEILCPVADFSLSLSPDTRTIPSGNTASYTVTVTGTNGFANPVDLSVDDLPSGVTAQFNPSTINGSGTSTLTLSAADSVSPDIYVMNLSGVSGTISQDESLTLQILDGDADGDGTPDSWMIQYFGHATGQASDRSRGTDDADGDGSSNAAEFQAGTNPLDPQSGLRVSSMAIEGSNFRVGWAAIGGKRYVVEAASQMSPNAFVGISPVIQAGGSGETTLEYLDVGGFNASRRYYRVRIEP